ncbi:hypothetical protein PMAYCL1PPCAC_24225 [Pristionchus mayeri]|uniref:Uncharacterized protein n=1 Tax=Pristionchus mayeri TaxID=1317129 RepID=A0AAN5I7G8_9BILA|nr:hypothetical protein PMAYCL1PPCAC_24225 [Pristionchus mayeri]
MELIKFDIGHREMRARIIQAWAQPIEAAPYLISVVVGLVGSSDRDSEVVRLLLREGGQLDSEVIEVKSGDLLVEGLGEDVQSDGVLVLGSVLGPDLDLGDDLIGERSRHDERGVASGASKVDKTSLGEEDHVTAILEEITVNLGLDSILLGILVEPLDINLAVEVSDVADNRVVGELEEVLATDDSLTTGRGNDDLGLRSVLLESGNLVPYKSGLKGVDGVDLGDDDSASESLEGGSGSLSDISVSGHNSDLSGEHDISGALDAVRERLSDSVEVVELGLGDGVVDVDGRNLEVSLGEHFSQVVHSSGGLLGESADSSQILGVLGMDDVGEVSSVIEDHVEGLAIGPDEGLLDAPLVLLLGLSLPREHGDTGSSNCGGSVILGGEDVARGPLDRGSELLEGLDEHSSLDGHVEASSDTGTCKRFAGSVLGAHGHKTGHLILGKSDFLQKEVGLRHISNLVSGLGHLCK